MNKGTPEFYPATRLRVPFEETTALIWLLQARFAAGSGGHWLLSQ